MKCFSNYKKMNKRAIFLTCINFDIFSIFYVCCSFIVYYFIFATFLIYIFNGSILVSAYSSINCKTVWCRIFKLIYSSISFHRPETSRSEYKCQQGTINSSAHLTMSPGDKSSKFKNGIEVEAQKRASVDAHFSRLNFILWLTARQTLPRSFIQIISYTYNRQSVIVCKTANVRVK